MLVVNTSMEVQNIKIVHADGRKDSINLQPRGGKPVQLPPGAEIDPTMIAQYMKVLRTQPKLVVPETVAQDTADQDSSDTE